MTPAVVAPQRAGIPVHAARVRARPGGVLVRGGGAEKTGVDPARVFKTLVVTPGRRALRRDRPRRGAARPARARQAAPLWPTGPRAERATGYVIGGISPLGQRKRLPTLVDASALGHETIFVSAGRRGLELELAPGDLVRLTDARVAAVASGA